MKKVTIVIPNYNGLKFMEPCMAALDKQLCRDFELLVVDNGSTDGSVEWLKEHGLPSIFLETNTGFSGAVNTPEKPPGQGRRAVSPCASANSPKVSSAQAQNSGPGVTVKDTAAPQHTAPKGDL